ncbi:MAG: hypothetical protein HC897_20200 [Thermoanaerobaculia bacterium]|nr:hypothetical protein [Thermoanaerobaculia bacterium]
MDLDQVRSRRKEQRLKRLSQKAQLDPKQVLASKEYWHPDFCRRFFDFCAVSAFRDPRGAIALASLGTRLAARTSEPKTLSHAFGVLGSAHRLFGQVKKSERCFEIAATYAQDDVYCLADITRRLIPLRVLQSRFDDAFELATEAIKLYKVAGKQDGVGRGMLYRGILLLKANHLSDALADFYSALELLSPSDSEIYYTASLYNITLALAKGSNQHVAAALAHLSKLKKSFKGQPGIHLIRLKLRWVEGLLYLRQGHYLRGRRRLESVKEGLLKLGLPLEVAAITADLATAYHPNFRGIQRVAETAVRRQPFEPAISDLFQKVMAAAKAERDSVLEHLAAIRQAVAHPSFPAFVPCAQ